MLNKIRSIKLFKAQKTTPNDFLLEYKKCLFRLSPEKAFYELLKITIERVLLDWIGLDWIGLDCKECAIIIPLSFNCLIHRRERGVRRDLKK